MTHEQNDPELVGHALDLSRPELRPILDRYCPRTALVVGCSEDIPLHLSRS